MEKTTTINAKTWCYQLKKNLFWVWHVSSARYKTGNFHRNCIPSYPYPYRYRNFNFCSDVAPSRILWEISWIIIATNREIHWKKYSQTLGEMAHLANNWRTIPIFLKLLPLRDCSRAVMPISPVTHIFHKPPRNEKIVLIAK